MVLGPETWNLKQQKGGKMMVRRRSFTLLELIIVIIIIGILATLGFVQYSKIVEKGRKAEASTNLGALRSMAYVWNQEGGHTTDYPGTTDLPTLLGLPTSCSQTTHYFAYTMDSSTGLGTATRCTGTSGKQPGATDAYSMTLTIDGTKGGDW